MLTNFQCDVQRGETTALPSAAKRFVAPMDLSHGHTSHEIMSDPSTADSSNFTEDSLPSLVKFSTEMLTTKNSAKCATQLDSLHRPNSSKIMKLSSIHDSTNLPGDSLPPLEEFSRGLLTTKHSLKRVKPLDSTQGPISFQTINSSSINDSSNLNRNSQPPFQNVLPRHLTKGGRPHQEMPLDLSLRSSSSTITKSSSRHGDSLPPPLGHTSTRILTAKRVRNNTDEAILSQLSAAYEHRISVLKERIDQAKGNGKDVKTMKPFNFFKIDNEEDRKKLAKVYDSEKDDYAVFCKRALERIQAGEAIIESLTEE